MHLGGGGEGVAIVLRNVTEGEGGLTEVLCNAKVYISFNYSFHNLY